MIKIENLNFSYKKNVPVLKNINLNINAGESVAIVGKSGSGKTTLLSIMAILLDDYEGNYSFHDESINQLSNKERVKFRGENIGIVFQGFYLLPHLTVLQNVMLPLDGLQYSKEEKINLAQESLSAVGMGEFVESYPDEVSGGQAQRVAIARALVRRPSIIMGDEPTGNLDESNSDMIIKLLKKNTNKDGTLIVITHDMSVAEQFDRVIRLNKGEISS